MPSAFIQKLSDQGKGSIAELEKKFDKAKSLAKDQGKEGDFAYITGIFKKMVGVNEMLSYNDYHSLLTESLPNLEKMFDELNIKYFDNSLPKIKLKWVNSKKRIGEFTTKVKRSTGELIDPLIKISKTFTQSELSTKNTMAHEMIHYWNIFNGRLRDNHGSFFLAKADSISKTLGTKILPTEDIGSLEVFAKGKKKDLDVIVLLNSKGEYFAQLYKLGLINDGNSGILTIVYTNSVNSGKYKKAWFGRVNTNLGSKHSIKRKLGKTLTIAKMTEAEARDILDNIEIYKEIK